MLPRCSGVHRSKIVSFLVNKHISACDSLASRALQNPNHSLHAAISKSISLSSSRSNYRLIFASTNVFRSSTTPYLDRLLHNCSCLIDEPSERLSRLPVFFHCAVYLYIHVTLKIHFSECIKLFLIWLDFDWTVISVCRWFVRYFHSKQFAAPYTCVYYVTSGNWVIE